MKDNPKRKQHKQHKQHKLNPKLEPDQRPGDSKFAAIATVLFSIVLITLATLAKCSI